MKSDVVDDLGVTSGWDTKAAGLIKKSVESIQINFIVVEFDLLCGVGRGRA